MIEKVLRKSGAAILATVLLLTGCASGQMQAPAEKKTKEPVEEQNVDGEVLSYSQDIFAMDTYMTVTGYGENAQKAVDEAIAEIERLDNMLSTGKADSEISIVNAAGGGKLSQDAFYMIKRSLEISESTKGAYDITVYPLMQLWGFDDGEFKVPSEAEISETLKKVDYKSLDLDEENSYIKLGEGQGIDLGGIAKGYTSSRIMDIFEKYDLVSGLVYLGGNVQCYKRKVDGSKWVCGIQDPFNPGAQDKYLGILKVEDKAVITSGPYERFFVDEATGKKYHHIIDPSNGFSAENGLISVTIVTDDGTLADALSTSLYVMGLQSAIDYRRDSKDSFDFIMMDESKKVYVSEGVADDFETDYECEVVRP